MGVVNYLTVDGEILSETRNGVEHDYLPDIQGSTIGLLDSNQNITDQMSYWPYGEEHGGNSTLTPMRYLGTLGCYTDVLNSRIYERYRSYQPQFGRWMTVDPLWPSEDAYTYTLGDPMGYVDPSGLGIHHHYQKPKRLPFRGASGLNSYYGRFCGSNRIQNPWQGILPQDCLDACCEIHDRCVEAHKARPGNLDANEKYAHQCCDQALHDCADWARNFGCCSKSPNPKACWTETKYIMDGMYWALKHYGGALPAGKCIPRKDWPRYYLSYWLTPTSCVPLGTGHNPKQPDPDPN